LASNTFIIENYFQSNTLKIFYQLHIIKILLGTSHNHQTSKHLTHGIEQVRPSMVQS